MRKKAPRLGIIAAKNQVAKQGMPLDERGHLMRVYNKEYFPCK